MHRFRVIGLLFLVMTLAPLPARALRCSSDLVQEGESKFELIQKCGEPLSVEFIGYKLDGRGNRDLLIEHLYYGPWNGWYYLIEVVGGRVARIETFKEN